MSSDPLELSSHAEPSEGSVGENSGLSDGKTSEADGKTSEAESELSCLGSTGSSSSVGPTNLSIAKESTSDRPSSSERSPGASEDEVHGGKLMAWVDLGGMGMGAGVVGEMRRTHPGRRTDPGFIC